MKIAATDQPKSDHAKSIIEDITTGPQVDKVYEGKVAKIKQGQAIFFASFIRHRVKPVIRGNRKSLVMWFGGTPFK